MGKTDEFGIKHEELCNRNEELCIKNEELLIKNDEFCRDRRASAEPAAEEGGAGGEAADRRRGVQAEEARGCCFLYSFVLFFIQFYAVFMLFLCVLCCFYTVLCCFSAVFVLKKTMNVIGAGGGGGPIMAKNGIQFCINNDGFLYLK